MKTIVSAVAVLLLTALASQASELVEPISVTKVYGDGRHNAFTALVRWKDQYWLAFRNADSHGYGEADIVLLRSSDAEEWTEARRFNILPDDRDPQFLATEDRLFLYIPALEGARLTTFVTFTGDGEAWSSPAPVYEPRFILWKPFREGDRFLATAHKKVEGDDGGKERQVHLISSADGLAWQKLATIRAGTWESETTLLAESQGKLVAFIRTKYSVPGHIMESQPPYTDWTERSAGVHLSGHSVHTFDGVTYLFSRTMNDDGSNQGTMIYTYQDGTLTPYCALPAAGDCSYPEAVQIGDRMLVSYYATLEGATNVYLARVPLK
jgi:hypothetical protein